MLAGDLLLAGSGCSHLPLKLGDYLLYRSTLPRRALPELLWAVAWTPPAVLPGHKLHLGTSLGGGSVFECSALQGDNPFSVFWIVHETYMEAL